MSEFKKVKNNVYPEFYLPLHTCMAGYFIKDKVVNDLLRFRDDNLKAGKFGKGTVYSQKYKKGSNVNPKEKDSLDLSVSCQEIREPILSYRSELQNCLMLYAEKFSYIKKNAHFNIREVLNFQHYPIGGGFKVWHCENNGYNLTEKNRNANSTEDNEAKKIMGLRCLVYMTFLNDVEDGGTEFLYQNLTVPAKKGLTLFWPAYWTHTHRGQVSNTKEKTIITGWYNYT